LGEEGGKEVGEALAVNNSLKVLDLRDCHLGPKAAEVIGSALKANSTLKTLHLTNNKLGDKGAESIAEALAVNKSLLTIDLGSNDITRIGEAKISIVIRLNDTLDMLDMSKCFDKFKGDNKMKGQDFAEGLKENKRLSLLEMGKNRIDAEGAKALSHAIVSHPLIESLNLGFNWLQPEGGIALSKVLAVNLKLIWVSLCISLKNLLGNGKLGTEGVAAVLEAIKTHPAIEHLDLCKILD
jgi:Leucine-rich repeat (LRR) protein